MGVNYIYQKCTYCGADGKIETPGLGPVPTPIPEGWGVSDCPKCGGVGKVLWGYLQDELEGEE